MMMVRVLSLLAAGIVMISAPVVLDPNGHGLPTWKALTALVAMVATAGSFVYPALVGSRLRRDHRTRVRAGALLVIPILVSTVMLVTEQDEIALACSGLLLGVALLLLLGVLFPEALGKPERRRRVQGGAVAGG